MTPFIRNIFTNENLFNYSKKSRFWLNATDKKQSRKPH